MFNQKTITLEKLKHTPGQANQRFGDWKKGEPTVLIENRQWTALGKPTKVKVTIDA